MNEDMWLFPLTYFISKSFVLLSNRVLLVDRKESRPAEWLSRKLLSAVSAVTSTSLAIPIQVVAKAIVSNTVLQPGQKTEILENNDIAGLGKERSGEALK